MGKSKMPSYRVDVSYEPGWYGHTRTFANVRGVATEADARQLAKEQVAEMRRGGARSPIRKVQVKLWPSTTPQTDPPPIFEASYYDAAQGLSETEAYAARAHHWHSRQDRGEGYAYQGLPLLRTYSGWDDSQGPQPDVCPSCGRELTREGQLRAFEVNRGREFTGKPVAEQTDPAAIGAEDISKQSA